MNQKVQSSPAVDADYMFTPVPPDARRPTWKQVAVWVGFGYVATGLFIGGTLAGPAGGAGVSFPMALLAIAIGMGILFVLTSLLGVIAQRTGLSLALLCRYAYGAKGMNLPMLTLGWFSAITGMVGDIWGAFIGNPSGITVLDQVRGKPRPLGRGRIARTPSASFRRLMRRLLLLNVLADDLDGRTAAAPCEVRRRPQCTAP
ncbi:Cytosine/purine/uracil/thiamine/allantoin permease family protein [Cupriavidus necator H850]|uniref:cytosine permease n=1 Tax=Cupriavidus TaxID=106589 RepID=UPI001E528CB5|nr:MULTISPECIES: cytosine permease [Cupriavidus]KAI3596366.1 Cytosine/purine/uracil/thiamine/allantoin permease family protein [Cupriavidus necator H850]